MEALIESIIKAMGVSGNTLDAIHDAVIKKGWSEEDFFLAYKAAELLYQSRAKK